MQKNQIGVDIISNYYPEYDDLLPEEIIKSEKNYVGEMPITLTYKELKERWREKYKWPESKINDFCFNNKLGAYLIMDEQYISTSSNLYSVNGITTHRKGNCGNPFYLKRYKGLERLIVKDSAESNIALEKLFINKKLSLCFESRDGTEHYYANILQSTDIETKFYIVREIDSLRKEKEIKLTDVVFIEEEIKNLETKEEERKIFETIIYKEHLNNELFVRERVSELQKLEYKNLSHAQNMLKEILGKAYAACFHSADFDENKAWAQELLNIINEFSGIKPSRFLKMYCDFQSTMDSLTQKQETVEYEILPEENMVQFNAFYFRWQHDLSVIPIFKRGLSNEEAVKTTYRYLSNLYSAIKFNNPRSQHRIKIDLIQNFKIKDQLLTNELSSSNRPTILKSVPKSAMPKSNNLIKVTKLLDEIVKRAKEKGKTIDTEDMPFQRIDLCNFVKKHCIKLSKSNIPVFSCTSGALGKIFYKNKLDYKFPSGRNTGKGLSYLEDLFSEILTY